MKNSQLHRKIINNSWFAGLPIRTTLDNSTTLQYADQIRQLTMQAKSTVRAMDPQNNLFALRMKTKKHEIMVVPGNILIEIRVESYVLLSFA